MLEPEYRQRIGYEWVAEHVDEYEDIQDLDHTDALNEQFVKQTPMPGTVRVDIGLIRRKYTEAQGELERDYWYPNPDHESDYTPPKKYLEEASKFGLLKA